MNGKHTLLIKSVILAALALTSACHPGQISGGTPTSMEPLSNLDNLSLNAKLESGETLRILPMGNAIVEGFCDKPSHCKVDNDEDVRRPLTDGVSACSYTANELNPQAVGFRGFLRDKLAAEGVNMNYVGSVEAIDGLAHEGHFGFGIGDIDYCVQKAGWLEQTKPDIILLLTGSIQFGHNDPNVMESTEQMLQDLDKLLRDIYKIMPETTEVIVAQYPSRYDKYPLSDSAYPADFAEITTEYNDGIPGVVEKLRAEGKHVSTVNMWDAFQSTDDYDEAGVRPRSVAAERMAQIWLEKILEILGHPVLVSASPTLTPSPTVYPTPITPPQIGEALRIMPLGEAVIEGLCDRPSNCVHPAEMQFPRDGVGIEACNTNWTAQNPGVRGFRQFLRDRLISAGVNMTYVGSVQVVEGLAHEGHTGFLISDMNYCIQNAKWLEQAKPEMILLYAGGMDLFAGISPEVVIESLKGLLTQIYQELPETTEVIVAQISPTREGVHILFDPAQPLMNPLIAEYNAMIPGVVEEFRAEGKQVSYVDLQHTILSTDEFDDAGSHPDVAASERMAQVWFEKIMEILKK